jgi:hypothetical protein
MQSTERLKPQIHHHHQQQKQQKNKDDDNKTIISKHTIWVCGIRRNRYVAKVLRESKIATLLFDLLTAVSSKYCSHNGLLWIVEHCVALYNTRF